MIAGLYVRRLSVLIRLRKYDIIWIEKEIFPFSPAYIETFIFKCGAKIIIDYDDAVFLNYRTHRCSLVRLTLGKKIDRIMKSADVITAGNIYLRDYARACGASDVRFIPSVVDINKYPIKKEEPGKIFRIGWIGSPATGRYLESLSGMLKTLAATQNIKLVVIGLDKFEIPGVEVETITWTEESEANDLQHMDIGIMPLFRTEWEKGKCGYKLIQYMACGLPVVATGFGANNDIIEDGKEGFLVQSEDEWIAAISRLIEDRDLYISMSRSARSKVEQFYSLQSQHENLLSLFLE